MVSEDKGHTILEYAVIRVVQVVFQSVLGSLELDPPGAKDRRLYTEWVPLLV